MAPTLINMYAHFSQCRELHSHQLCRWIWTK